MEKTARKIAARLQRERPYRVFRRRLRARHGSRLNAKGFRHRHRREPETVQKLFPRTYAVGAHFGVIIVLENGFQFEVATFRSDEAYIDGRHPSAVHFSSPEEDAKRRDFTINGMFYDPVKEEVIDFVGGRADIAAKLVRAIGDPAQRFAEDRLRMLRAVRFATVLDYGSTIKHGTRSSRTRRRSMRSARNESGTSSCGFFSRRNACVAGICSIKRADAHHSA